MSWDCPAMGDVSWVNATKPLLRFLDVPRSWTELREYGRCVKLSGCLVRHQLAFLEDRHLAVARHDAETGEWMWLSAAARNRVSGGIAASYPMVVADTAQAWIGMMR